MERLTKILSIAGGIFVFLLAATIYVGVRVLGVFAPGMSMQRPAEFAAAKVTTGAGRFQKNLYFADARLGAVTDLRFEMRDPGNPDLAVVGTESAVFLNEEGNVRERVTFATDVERESISLVRSNDAATPFFLSSGSWSVPTALFDSSGKKLWTYESLRGEDGAVAGDINGDGKIEVAIGMNGNAGVGLVDESGHQIWSKPDGNVWHVEILAGGGGIPGRILHSNASGHLIVRDPGGNVVERHRLDMYLSDFSLVKWNNEPRPTHIVASDSGSVYVYAATGVSTAHFDAPAPILYDEIRAVTLRLSDDKTYLAVLRDYSRWNRSVLTINSAIGNTGSLVYREILDDLCGPLTSLPYKGSEALLVGCQGKLWRYDASRSQ